MSLSHEEYLKQTLRDKKLELEYLKMNHRVAIAEFNVKADLISAQIESIDKQLSQVK